MGLARPLKRRKLSSPLTVTVSPSKFDVLAKPVTISAPATTANAIPSCVSCHRALNAAQGQGLLMRLPDLRDLFTHMHSLPILDATHTLPDAFSDAHSTPIPPAPGPFVALHQHKFKPWREEEKSRERGGGGGEYGGGGLRAGVREDGVSRVLYGE
ncbi:hypothetical protein DXG01_005635 [Tephrocybe rancida]|nr:hypothetical protein DXG01_005635 [Tephrocybe rancida]